MVLKEIYLHLNSGVERNLKTLNPGIRRNLQTSEL